MALSSARPVMRLSASLVLYNNAPAQFGQAILSYLEGTEGLLVVIDNSPEPLHHDLFENARVRYEFVGENLGFGKGHNRALSIIGDNSDAHLFLNPDIVFDKNVLSRLLDHFERIPDAGAVMPRIVYQDGSLQRLCKLLPTPTHLFLRRFISIPAIKDRINRQYELHGLPQDQTSCVPSLSGCFLLVRMQALREVGGFDERYFMYMEDIDLVRRIGDGWKTMYEPCVTVVHGYEKASYTNPVLMKAHMRSAILYFSKWGWFFDSQRWQRNNEVTARLKASRRA